MSKQNTPAQASLEIPKRFTVAQRIEHIILLASFATLGLTGLVQKFAANPFADWIIKVLGGIESTRIIHRAAAITFALLAVYHIIVLGYKIFVRRIEMTMLPGPKDALDALDVLRYNLWLTKEHPRLPRYNFTEKAEYWALIWGGIVMGVTGFMLWNPLITARFLPGQFIPAAKAAHGGEAILAVLAIFVWHFYNVHVKTFNKSMFTGRMNQHQMAEEHGEELERLAAGRVRPAPGAQGIRRRERIYIPIAIVGTLAMVGTILWAITAETTAISSLPPVATEVPVFAPLTPTPVPSATADNTTIGKPIPHAVAGQEQCGACHGPTGVSPMPADHAGRPVASCLICHKPGPTPTPGPAETAAGGPSPIPANHDLASDAYRDCTLCHGAGSIKPFPENHASFAADGCTTCHKQAQ